MRHPCLTWWPEKFFGDTADMSADGAAYYAVLLGHAWIRGGSLPNDDDKLRLMTRLPKMRWAAVRKEILQRFNLAEDGRLHQKRMDEEWALAERRQGMASKAHVAAHQKAEDATRNPRKVFKVQTRQTAKNPMISTRARPDNPTPTQKNSVLRTESSSGAPASLSVLDAHATRAPCEAGNVVPLHKPKDELAAPDKPSDAERARIAEVKQPVLPSVL